MNAPRPAPSSAAARSTPLARLLATWHACSPRERRLILIAGGVVALGLVLSLADGSARERSRLDRLLPRAQAQLEQTQEAATEIAALRGRPPAQALAGPALADAVGAAAKARGLAVTAQSTGDGVQIRGSGDFDTLITWLGTLHTDQGLRVQRIEIQRAGGQASVDALLAAPAAP